MDNMKVGEMFPPQKWILVAMTFIMDQSGGLGHQPQRDDVDIQLSSEMGCMSSLYTIIISLRCCYAVCPNPTRPTMSMFNVFYTAGNYSQSRRR